MNTTAQQTLAQNTFDDFDNHQLIWELYGELLDFYSEQTFSAKQVAYETGQSKQLINRILHRLIQHKAVICKGTDKWNTKLYKLNNAFCN